MLNLIHEIILTKKKNYIRIRIIVEIFSSNAEKPCTIKRSKKR